MHSRHTRPRNWNSNQ